MSDVSLDVALNTAIEGQRASANQAVALATVQTLLESTKADLSTLKDEIIDEAELLRRRADKLDTLAASLGGLL